MAGASGSATTWDNFYYALDRNHKSKGSGSGLTLFVSTRMGQIYEHATRVISWFGMNPEIVAYFDSVASYRLFSLKDGASFHNSEYWKRAWVSDAQSPSMSDAYEFTGLTRPQDHPRIRACTTEYLYGRNDGY
jgi:hypothetical protein